MSSTRLQKLLQELGEKVKRASALQAQPNEALEPSLAAPEPPKTVPALAELDLDLFLPSLAEAPTGPLRPKEPPPPSLRVDPEEITQRLTSEIKEHLEPLPKKAQALVLAFHTAALEAAVKQNMKLRHLSEVALFAPLEAVAAKLDVDRTTIWRWFEKYPILGKIIARREHYGSVTSFTTGNAMTWKTGTVWVVRLKPNLDTEARVRFYHLKHPWRDLERDIKRGHTASRLHDEECNDQRDLEELVTSDARGSRR